MAKKAETNKGKVIQPNKDLSYPITCTSCPEETILSKHLNQDQHIKNVENFMANKVDLNISKIQVPFSLEGEIPKIKINMPLIELLTQPMYRSQILKVINIGNDANTLHLVDDKPELLFGPKIEGKYQEGAIPPFYISLNIHEKILHNSMLDSSASQNLMPKVVMERLDL